MATGVTTNASCTTINLSGSNASFSFNGSGTVSGLITESSGTMTLFAVGGSGSSLTISNTRGTTVITPMIGRDGSPSPLGKNGVINLSSNNTDAQPNLGLLFSGVDDESDKTFVLNFAGGGADSLAAILPNTTTGTGGARSVIKSGTGSWTLTGANTYSGSTSITAGTLLFAKRTSLSSGGTASWTQANISTTASDTAAWLTASSPAR